MDEGNKNQSRHQNKPGEIFRFFNEIGIINQLASTVFNNALPNGLHVSHFAVINHLTRLGDGKTLLQIARAMQITKATMSHTASVLEKGNFITISPNPDDGRSKLIFLTNSGRQFQKEAIASLKPAFEFIARKGLVDEMSKATATLEKVRKLLDENRKL